MRNKKLVLSITISAVIILAVVFSVIIPTFSRFRNGLEISEWDGLAASGFKRGTGTQEDPYIISTPNEFAYFALSMEDEDYEGKYIKLTKDIVINKGVFKNNTYIYDDNTYYLNNDKYYEEDTYDNEIGSINIFPIIDGFKGNFDGDFHTIYGLYEKETDKNALFTDFCGKLENLYLDNAYIKGGRITAGVVADANNATIKNVLFNGTVIGNTQKHETTKTIEIDDFTVTSNLNKTIDIPIISNISKNTLKGTCTGPNTFTINDEIYQCSYFEIDVTNDLNIEVDQEATFEDITYTLTYDENKTGGIVGLAYNTELDGLVNKGNINGMYTAGILGTGLNTNIKNTYNSGKITGESSTGIVDTIMYSNTNIENVYNNGELISNNKAGLINNLYLSTISVDKSFNTYNTAMINNNISSTLETTYSYNVENYTNSDFRLLNLETINAKYPKYIDNENISNGNIWVGEEIPILYFDDIKNRTVQIKIDNKVWDNLKINLQDIKYDDEQEVLITTTDMYKPIKNVWYYTSNEIIDEEDLDSITWTEYNGIFKLDDDVYVLYVKYEDYDDNIYYINTDKLIIGNIKTNVSIKSGNTTWSTYHNPTNKFQNKPKKYEIINNGTDLSISKIEYFISTDKLNKEDLNNTTWTTYTEEITPEEDSYIIYVKITTKDDNITYINTDRMNNMSYEIENIKSGNNMSFSNYMTYHSSFNFTVSLDHLVSLSNYKRYIKVDKMLPNNTIITLNTDGTYYEYKVTNHEYDSNLNSYLYPLSGFKEVGKITFDEYFDDDDYENKNESYNIFIDFSNIEPITDDYNISFIAKGTDIVNTKEEQNIHFNLVEQETNTLSINSSYNNIIDYGIENTHTINITTSLNPTIYNGTNIINTDFENLYEGVSIEVYDDKNNLVNRDIFKDLRIKYNNTIYVFDGNNRVNINLGKNYNQNINLDILTFDGNTDIEGTYYLKLKGYLSIDGINKKYTSTDDISIPLRFTKENNCDYDFEVELTSPIINKGGNFSFDITYDGELTDPKLKVSLYKKSELTAYNQNYELVDLKRYVENNLTTSSDYKYEINLEDLVLNIKDNVESNGYKFVFELYDGNDKITETTIKTIIR